MDTIKSVFNKGYKKGFVDGMLEATEICAFATADILKAINSSGNIKQVIFNDPATIVFWNDGTKTVVKADGEDFDKEKGLAMAIAKKAFGNSGNYYEVFKKYCPEETVKP